MDRLIAKQVRRSLQVTRAGSKTSALAVSSVLQQEIFV